MHACVRHCNLIIPYTLKDAFLWRCAQLISVGAMRGAAEAYYKIRTLSHNRIKRRSYSSFDHTTTDFDTPSTERTPSATTLKPALTGNLRRTFRVDPSDTGFDEQQPQESVAHWPGSAYTLASY